MEYKSKEIIVKKRLVITLIYRDFVIESSKYHVPYRLSQNISISCDL